jgi:hypothetical protein
MSSRRLTFPLVEVGKDREMSNERRVHEPWQSLRDIHLESLLLVSDVILGNGRLELDKGNDSWSIVEGPDEDGGTLDGLVLVDDIFDLAQLDTLTTELDLTILSAAVDNVTICTVHGDIASPVDALSRNEGVGYERLLGLLKLVEISTSELNSTDK